MSLIQQYGNVLVEGTFNATTTGGLVAGTAGTNSGRAATLLAGSSIANGLQNGFVTTGIWGYRITNNDATNAVDITYAPTSATGQNLPSSTNFFATIPAGGSYEVSCGYGVFNRLQIAARTATVACQLEVFG